MEHRQLGRSGFNVPVLTLGTGTFGGKGGLAVWGDTDEKEASRLIDICLDHGLTMFDSADIYSGGESERVLGAAIKGIAARFSGIESRMETEAVDVAVAVARKIANELIAREPLGEVTALVADCFAQLVSTPHIVVRINDSLFEAAHARIEALAKQNGFAGRLIILAEPGIATGDCRIEWADGGVVRERAAIEAKINELVGRYIASSNQA